MTAAPPEPTPALTRPAPAFPPTRRPSRGFSFVELLFAVAVLGIGFIMIAAVFPVGLQQTKLNMDETSGAATSRSMSTRLQQVAASTVPINTTVASNVAPFPCTYNTASGAAVIGVHYRGTVRTLNDPRDFTDATTIKTGGLNPSEKDRRRYEMWQIMANDLINPGDNRNASAVMFKRDATGVTTAAGPGYLADASAQVLTVNVQTANQTQYTADDVTVPFTGTPTYKTQQPIYNLEPRPVAVQVVYDPTEGVYVASFFSVTDLDGGGTYNRGGYPTGTAPTSLTAGSGPTWDDVLNAAVNAVGEGAYFVISDDRLTSVDLSNPSLPRPHAGLYNGRSFRIGVRRTDLAGLTFNLVPGFDLKPEAGPDGHFNATGNPSGDDLTAIGVDKSCTLIRSGLSYGGGASVVNPLGSTVSPPNPNPDGKNFTIAGSPDKQGAVALIVGRGFSPTSKYTPPAAGSVYSGPVQDVSLYTTFVTVPNQ